MRTLAVLIIFILAILVFCPVSQATADNQDVGPSGSNIWVNVGFGSTSWQIVGFAATIVNAPDNYDFGVVDDSATPVTGLNYFAVTNNSGFAVNITIHSTDMTGGNTWTLADDAVPGANIVGLKAGLDGGDYTIIVKKNAPYNILKSGLAGGGGSQKWGLKLYVPTSTDDGEEKSGVVTVTGVVP